MRSLQQTIALRRRQDRVFHVLGALCTAAGVLVFGALLADLLWHGFARIDWAFVTSYPSRIAERAGILAALQGSLAVMVVTAAVAVPLGVAAGVYLEEYAPKNRLTAIIEINIANLAGVPSVIYGLMALGVLVYVFGLGPTVLTAGLTLAALILPVVIVATREALRAIPRSIREASHALGATQWETVRWHLLPYSLGGIATGVILGLSRAIGETAPLVTIGALAYVAFPLPGPIRAEPPFLSFAWLDARFTVLPIQMFNWVSRPDPAFQANAAAAGAILLGMTLLMNGVAIWIRYRFRKKINW